MRTSVLPLASAAVLFTVAACASGPATSAPRERERIGAFGSPTEGGTYGLSVEVTRTDLVYTDSLPVDGGTAWAALPAIFRVLELPNAARDNARRSLSISGLRVRRIDGEALSRHLDCGRGLTAGPIADSYDVFIWVETRLIPREGEAPMANVVTSVTANARPAASSGNEVACQSTGRLERRISALLHDPARAASPAR
jgi:hypothetical protein